MKIQPILLSQTSGILEMHLEWITTVLLSTLTKINLFMFLQSDYLVFKLIYWSVEALDNSVTFLKIFDRERSLCTLKDLLL